VLKQTREESRDPARSKTANFDVGHKKNFYSLERFQESRMPEDKVQRNTESKESSVFERKADSESTVMSGRLKRRNIQ